MATVRAWDAAFERACHARVETICGGGPSAGRDRAWQALLADVAPHLERWAEQSPVLRRVGLTGEDEPRAVLVDVIDRLCDRDFANLRSYLARQPLDAEEEGGAAAVERLSRLCDVDEAAPTTAAGDLLTGTPLRGWLLMLTRFAVTEHVKRRFGWRGVSRWSGALTATARAASVDALLATLTAKAGVIDVEHDAAAAHLVIVHRPAQIRVAELERVIAAHGYEVRSLPPPPGKRDVGSGAERLDVAPEAGERPPLSTLLGVRRALAEITAHIAQFPAAQQRALQLWLDDHGFDAIAAEMKLGSAREAQALVRAAHARLRDRFRGSWPELFGQ